MSSYRYEPWIWTELLAFDNTQPDQGVQSYLDRVGFVPQGVSLLVSSIDFILLHDSLERETPLFPEVCSRCGHAGNEERARQAWTNHQLRSLVENLQAQGVEVFFSVFMYYLKDRYHREWASDHPEVLLTYDGFGRTDGVNPLARLRDGTLFEDIFIPRIARVVQDYGFDGWHGPDGQGPGGAIAYGDASDGFIGQFADYLGAKLPDDFELVGDQTPEALRRRMDYIWNHLRKEWTDFHVSRWTSFWTKAAAALRSLGKKSMINSANTKAAFEGISIYGIDYRPIAAAGVDYLVVETVAANLALIVGAEWHFDFAATLAEMKAFVPDMKIIFLHGLKDVVESYDLLRHAPARLEREVFTLANQYYCTADQKLTRCADGFLACLGDGLQAHEWEYLGRQWRMSYSFEPVRVGALTWVFDDAAVDALREDFPRHGTWPAFKQVAYLTEHYDLPIAVIGAAALIDGHTQPLLAPNFDLFGAAARRKLLAYDRAPVVLLGNVVDQPIPEDASAVLCRIAETYILGCVILNGAVAPEVVTVAGGGGFADVRPPYSFEETPPYMSIPEEFWNRAAQAITRCLHHWQDRHGRRACRAGNLAKGLRVMTMENDAGAMRTALISCAPHYICPEYTFRPPPTAATKISGFPYSPVAMADGAIVTGWRQTVLHIPPYGIIVADVEYD